MTTKPIPQCCGTETKLIDRDERSATYGCGTCSDGFLVHDQLDQPIRLPEFLTRRGEGKDQRALDDRDFSRKLVLAAFLEMMPSPAVATDFGIQSEGHLFAVQRAVSMDYVGLYELDRVLGSGEAMTDLFSQLPGIAPIEFETPYDIFYRPKNTPFDPAFKLIPDEPALPPLKACENEPDPQAVLKWFAADSSWTWYVLEYDPQDRVAFALVDGHELEMGYVNVGELERARGPLGQRIERDLHFEPTRISEIKRDLERRHER